MHARTRAHTHTHTSYLVFCPSHFPAALTGRCPAGRDQRTRSTTKRCVSGSAAPRSPERRHDSTSQLEGS
eukprot:12220102-Alexandrium_andersonii.AAC.1